jgi:hypothetical protein
LSTWLAAQGGQKMFDFEAVGGRGEPFTGNQIEGVTVQASAHPLPDSQAATYIKANSDPQ